MYLLLIGLFFLKVRCYKWGFLFTGTPENIWNAFLHIFMLPHFPFVSASVASADWINLGGSIVVWMGWMQNPLIECGPCKGLEHLQILVPGRGRVLESVSVKIPRADCICLLSGHFWCIVIIVNILNTFIIFIHRWRRKLGFEGWKIWVS